jgi:hypothetical protein
MGGMGEAFYPNPNGPVDDRRSCDFRVKVPVWEGIRKYLYRTTPELEIFDVVQFRKARRLRVEWYVDCECAEGKHTCSPYYQCVEYDGWDGNQPDGLNTYCYTYLGLGPSTEF